MRLSVFVALAVVVTQSVAFAQPKETRKEQYARVDAEWEKFQTQYENVCIGDGYIILAYAVFDKDSFRPVLFPPSLPNDLLATLATRLGTIKDAEAKEALEGAFNAALNEKIEALRNGRYNQITVVVKKGVSFWISPTEDQAETLLVWMPLSVAKSLLYIAGGEKPTSPVLVFSPDGSLAPMDATTRPKWLHTNSITEAGGGGLRSEGKRLKLLKKCP